VRRAIVPLALVLALLTGAVLAETRRVLGDPAVTGIDPRSTAAASAVRRFYDGVNRALATGEDARLEGVLAEDFVDHAPRPGTTPDRAGFLRGLRSLRATAPALRLTVLDLVAERDRVAARVVVEGADGATFLGLPVAPGQLWGTDDVFRVESGAITERWGDPTAAAFFDPLLTVTVPIAEPVQQALTLERWTYAPAAAEARETKLGFVVLLVEAGTLTVRVTPGGAMPVAGGKKGTAGGGQGAPSPGAPEFLGPGDGVVIPQGGRIALRNDGTAPVEVLAVVAAVPEALAPELARGAPAGIAHTVLAGGPLADLLMGAATVAIGRAAFGPGEIFPAHRVEFAELVAVEAGSLALADGGGAWVSALPNALPRRSGEGPIPTTGGARVDPGVEVGYFVAGDAPLGIVLVTIAPATA
jgi:predicted ester cyclase